MILSEDYLVQLKSCQLKNHVNKLIKIQKQFFGTEPQKKILGKFKTNKNFQLIVRSVCSWRATGGTARRCRATIST